VDLVRAGFGQNNIKLGLLFSSRSSRTAASGGSNSNRSSGGNAPLLFQQLRKLSCLKDGQARQVLNDLSKISHFLFPLKVRTHVFSEEERSYAASSFRA